MDQLRSEYNRADAAREKPPNVREVSERVQLRLATAGPYGKQTAD